MRNPTSQSRPASRRISPVFVRRLSSWLVLSTALTWGIARGLNFYFDQDGVATGNNAATGANLGGQGSWDTTSTSWWDGSSGTDTNWTNSTSNTAIFTGTGPSGAGNITLSQPITAGALVFSTSGYNITGNTLTLGNGTNAVITLSQGAAATISSVLSGTSGLTVQSGVVQLPSGTVQAGTTTNAGTNPFGVLTLTNANNNFGNTTINSGTVTITNDGALGPDTNTVTVNGGGLGTFGGALVLAGGYTSGVTFGHPLSLSGNGVGGGSEAALYSAGNNTITGAVTTSAANTTVLDAMWGTTTMSGQLTIGTGQSAQFAGEGNWVVNNVAASSATSIFETTGVPINASSGETTLIAPNYLGTVKVTGGNLRVSSAANLGTNTTATSIELNGGTLEIRDDTPNYTNKEVTTDNGASTTLFVDRAVGGSGLNQTVTFATLVPKANVVFTLSGGDGYGVTFNANTNIGNAANKYTITNNLNGLLFIGGSTFWAETNTGTRALTINGTGNTTIAGSITATAAAVDTFTAASTLGTVTIMGTASTYLGATTINAGTLAITDFGSINGNNGAGINIGATTVAATLAIGTSATGANFTTNAAVNLAGTKDTVSILANQTAASPVVFNGAFTGTATGAKTLTLGGTSTQANQIAGAISDGSGTISVAKTGAGTWLLSGANTYSGTTTVENGILKIEGNAGNLSVIAGGGAITFGSDATTLSAGGTFEYDGAVGTSSIQTLGALTPAAGAGSIVTTAAGTSATLTFSSLVVRTAGATVDFAPGANTTISFTTAPGVTNGIITGTLAIGYATYNGTNWAALGAGNSVVAYTGYNTSPLPASGTTSSTSNFLESTSGSVTGALTINTLKIVGNTTTAPVITLGGIVTLSGQGVLFDDSLSGATIAGASGQLGLKAKELVVITNGSTPTNALTISAPIGGTTTVLTKSGNGTLIVSGNNAYTGNTNIDAGTLQLSGSTATLGQNLVAANVTTVRQNATLDINAAGASNTITIGALSGAGTVTNSGAGTNTAGTLSIGGSLSTAAGIFSGVLQDGGGVLNVTKMGTGVETLSGVNTYSGVTTIGVGTISANTLANIGTASSIGTGSVANNAASLVFNGAGILDYTGSNSISINRLFTMSGGAQISNDSANNSALIFNQTNAITFGQTTGQTLTLGGSSTGDNELDMKITDSGVGSFVTNVIKTGAGLWILASPTGNTYSGTTTISNGALRAMDGTTLPSTSALILGSGTTTGVLETSGTFTRSLGGLAGQVSWNSGLTTGGGGGFAATSSPLTVNLGGAGAQLKWGTGGFVPNGTSSLALNSTTALSEVVFVNPIDLDGATATINVLDNTTTSTDFATITGVISDSLSGVATLTKAGAGLLQLTGANTYLGSTIVSAGSLLVTSIGNSSGTVNSSLGSSVSATGGTLALSGGTLIYAGFGETASRAWALGAPGSAATAGTIDAEGSGALILTGTFTDNSTSTKAHTLTLTGESTAQNEITSNLSNSIAGGGALGVTVDGDGTWILSGQSTNSGVTTFTQGALGIGSSSNGAPGSFTAGPLGTGALTLTNSTVATFNQVLFAAHGDQTIANAVHIGASTPLLEIDGDYSLTFNGAVDNNTEGNINIVNNLPTGKSLTINGTLSDTSGVAGKTFTFSGTGETVLNGAVQDSVAVSNTNVTVASGTVVFGAANTYIGTTTLTSGTLQTAVANAIPNGVSTGNVVINPATGQTMLLDTFGTAQTVNGLTATSAGNVIIDNTSINPASFTFGNNDQAVTFAPTGSLTIKNSGGGALSITKTGAGAATISNATLTYTGGTNVNGGTLTISSQLNGTNALSVTGAGSVLNINGTGGILNANTIQSVTDGGGATLNLVDGTGTPLTSLTSLSLAVGTGNATLDQEIGPKSDTLTTTSITFGNQTTINLTGLPGILGNTAYNLIVAPAATLSLGDFILGSTPGGTAPGMLTVSPDGSTLIYTTGAAAASTLYWNNTQGTNSWLTVNPGNLTNWTTDLAGTVEAGATPGAGTTVIFSSQNITSVGFNSPLVTTLDGSISIDNIVFTQNPTPGNGVTINGGSGGATNTLTINPANSANGITVQSGSGAIIINAGVVLGGAQTWTVDSSSSLTVNGNISGSGALTITATGTNPSGTQITLTGNNSFSGGMTITTGTVFALNSATAFGTGSVTLGDTVNDANPVSLLVETSLLTIPNHIILNSGTTAALTVGTPATGGLVSTTFSGGVTGTNNLIINNQSTGAATTTFSVNQINNVGTVTNMSSPTTGLVTISGGIGSNVTNIIEDSTSSAMTISTNPVTVNSSVGTTLTNVLGTKILTLSGGTAGTGNLILDNNSALASGITISGTLMVNNTGTITNTGTGTGSVTISAPIGTNVTGVTQNSTNSNLVLSGTNSYTTPTSVTAGKLVVSGSLAGTVNVAANATLASGANFSSQIAALTVASSSATLGGNVAPGDTGGAGVTTVGQLNVAGNVTLGSSGGDTNAAHLTMELGGENDGAGGGNKVSSLQYDRLALTTSGTLNLTNVNLALSETSTYSYATALGDGHIFFLITGASTINSTFANAAGGVFTDSTGNLWQISYDASFSAGTFTGGDDIAILAVAVPEPNSLSMLACSFGAALGLQRFRRRRK